MELDFLYYGYSSNFLSILISFLTLNKLYFRFLIKK